MHETERELITASGFKPRKRYADRQEYLKSLFLACVKIPNEDFDGLTDEAADWIDGCVRLHNAGSKDELPDFDDEEENEEDTASDEAEGNDPNEEPSVDDGQDDEDEDDTLDDEVEDSEETVQHANNGSAKEQTLHEIDDAIENETPKKKAMKPAKAKLKPSKKEVFPVERTIELDKWGCLVDSKNHEALALFEKGASAREVTEAIGGTYYNVLKRIARDGHTVEKKDHIITIIHKDAKKVVAKKGKK